MTGLKYFALLQMHQCLGKEVRGVCAFLKVFAIFFLLSLNCLALSVSLTHHLILLPHFSHVPLLSAYFSSLTHSFCLTVPDTCLAVFPPLGCFLFYPTPISF